MKDPQRELEHRRLLATADPNKRFGKLYCLVSHVQLLTIASQRVRQNTGGKTAGIDGQTRKHIDDDMLSRLALELGWTNYFRYAHNATQRFGYLTGVMYWLGAHYLGRKYRCSIKKVMRNHYGVDPTSGKRALYTSTQAGKCLYIWNKPPRRCSLFNNVVQAKDVQPLPMTSWASGRSYAQRMEVYNRSEQHCEHCGNISSTLIVHHPHRLGKLPKRKKGKSNVIASGQQQKVKLLCFECHKLHHPGGWSGKNKKSETEDYWRAGCSDELPAQF